MTQDRPRLPSQSSFYFSKFSDNELPGLFQAAKLWFPGCPALSVEIGSAIEEEIGRRVWNTSNTSEPPHGPEPLMLHFDCWSDHDVADGLMLSTVFSYMTVNICLGELIDFIASTLAQVAADRLRASGDERNAVHFVERNFPKSIQGTDDGNPEAN